jgi:large subunit ribosomal protein L13
MLVKRMIRGMLPKENTRGKEALRKLMVYSGNPKNLAASGKIENAEYDGVSKHITIQELCRSIGYSG